MGYNPYSVSVEKPTSEELELVGLLDLSALSVLLS